MLNRATLSQSQVRSNLRDYYVWVYECYLDDRATLSQSQHRSNLRGIYVYVYNYVYVYAKCVVLFVYPDVCISISKYCVYDSDRGLNLVGIKIHIKVWIWALVNH